jgi:superfamily II DNA or RNA helicase
VAGTKNQYLFNPILKVRCMKYPLPSEVVPFSKRQEINNKIMLLIESNKTEQVGDAAIFQAYTGDGGLHGLSFSDYNSYNQFSKAKKEIENGQFFTPAALCEQIVNCIPVDVSDLIADLTCGMGTFMNFFPVEANLFGCELDVKSYKVARHLYPKAQIENRDVRYYKPGMKMDVIIGNPPFNLSWETPLGSMTSQMFYMMKSAELLIPGGILAVIVPMSFMNDDFMTRNAIEQIDAQFSFLAQAKISPAAFSSIGVQNFPSKVMFFQRRFEALEANPYQANDFVDFEPVTIRKEILTPALAAKVKIAKEVRLSQACSENDWSFQNTALRKAEGYSFQERKYLFEISTHPLLKDKIGKARNYIHKFKTQQKPEGMKYEEWEQIRLTEAKVLAYLRQIIRSQNRVSKTGYSVYPNRAGIRIHAHDASTGSQFKTLGIVDLPWVDLVQKKLSLDNHFLKADLKPYKKLLSRKQRQFDLCSTPIKDTVVSKTVKDFVDAYTFIDPQNNVASLNAIQQGDVKHVLSRDYTLLSWEQGSGKTVSGYAAIRFMLETRGIRNAFVVAPPIAIVNTWVPFLTRNNADFIEVKSIGDFTEIQPGQIVVMPLNSVLTKLKHFLKDYIKTIKNNGFLLFDESDEITNYTSGRSQTMRDIFRRLKYKLLTTGTSTRNNISELYGQVELLYNNSINFICDAQKVYFEVRDKETSEVDIVAKENLKFNKPFPARGGLRLFKACYAPSKSTVFGIQKQNQDIYNQSSLEKLVARTIITRKFREIAGEGRYKLNTHKLVSKPFESELYRTILEELSTIIPAYYKSTGNSRKDTMLRIVRQLQLLIKSCSVPHLMLSEEKELPAKAPYIANMIKKYSDERVMVGCTSVSAATFYHEYLSKKFPDREVYLVTGGSHTIAQRKKVVNEGFKVSANGILVCTQQSLSSSIDIPECSRVILESLQWNAPKMSQFYFRAIRFTSPRVTNVHFVVYSNSIEVNLMALITAKERLNDFIKTLDLRDHNEVMEDFDFDESFLDMIISKDRDEDGLVKFSWGKQKAVA